MTKNHLKSKAEKKLSPLIRKLLQTPNLAELESKGSLIAIIYNYSMPICFLATLGKRLAVAQSWLQSTSMLLFSFDTFHALSHGPFLTGQHSSRFLLRMSGRGLGRLLPSHSLPHSRSLAVAFPFGSPSTSMAGDMAWKNQSEVLQSFGNCLWAKIIWESARFPRLVG